MGIGIGKIVDKAKKQLLETKGKNAFSAKDTAKKLKDREAKIKEQVEVEE